MLLHYLFYYHFEKGKKLNFSIPRKNKLFPFFVSFNEKEIENDCFLALLVITNPFTMELIDFLFTIWTYIICDNIDITYVS